MLTPRGPRASPDKVLRPGRAPPSLPICAELADSKVLVLAGTQRDAAARDGAASAYPLAAADCIRAVRLS